MRTERVKTSGITLLMGAGLVISSMAVFAQQTGRTPATNNAYMSAGDVERRAIAEGVSVITEIELEDRLAEVEGRDAQQRKVELVIDRRTGEVLQRKVKQARFGN
ncbi:PepSY domain-containing protein [Luteimonas marina]|uniref:PepSY domain-containing protein n=1 Tax=Luteimonas marina TaxID=488485 RepID=A0A5C5U6E7_9GAMM|nr:PepSY domain-containing protein [Luteimonas marina]TWT21446.1 PepSY domain-containing protein [Luteimonas marina]